ncbi:DUF5677 domain-containing protein [Morganella morganii]|uniref:DUF5677 domain-containing protein n=1 Tax=bacterium 19GA11TI05 TaxID=2920688 RepID=A0AAU6TVY5_UNCXX|nr:DUF5677 domain-containing protein [Morganella morganii]MDW7794877.1 DUF5677 domain-containing protein [Morganella morganii]HDS3817570.1 hypothetical protein [Morganella morganii subsp. morganii]
MSKNKKQKIKSQKSRTKLNQHTKKGKTLSPAFSQLKNTLGDRMLFSNWATDRLPELLWVAIIRVIYSQSEAIDNYNRILSFIKIKNSESLSDISLSGLSHLSPLLKEEFISCILEDKKTADALTVLGLFKSLPAREIWVKLLPNTKPDLTILMKAIGFCLFHQTQESTDCRWFSLMAYYYSGKIIIPDALTYDLINYPHTGEQKLVRPFIRAMEMVTPLNDITLDNNTSIKISWSEDFWNENWSKTPCLTHNNDNSQYTTELISIKKELYYHWKITHITTRIDPKHDAIFGFTLYTLRIVNEISASTIAHGIVGRLGMRSILECYITLHYLIKKNDPDLWSTWRRYGSGQAKLNALRFDEEISQPEYINSESLEMICGEDSWEEYLDIELGNWTKLDLRKISIHSGVKDLYDKYYSWTSSYSHGHWGAIRESSFQTCSNPLHRLHRIPYENTLECVINDAKFIFNLILDDLDEIYPSFKYRLSI